MPRIYGINPVLEALRAGRVTGLRVSAEGGRSVGALIKVAEREHVAIRRVPASELDRESRGGVHQGVVAEVSDAPVLNSGAQPKE